MNGAPATVAPLWEGPDPSWRAADYEAFNASIVSSIALALNDKISANVYISPPTVHFAASALCSSSPGVAADGTRTPLCAASSIGTKAIRIALSINAVSSYIANVTVWAIHAAVATKARPPAFRLSRTHHAPNAARPPAAVLVQSAAVVAATLAALGFGRRSLTAARLTQLRAPAQVTPAGTSSAAGDVFSAALGDDVSFLPMTATISTQTLPAPLAGASVTPPPYVDSATAWAGAGGLRELASSGEVDTIRIVSDLMTDGSPIIIGPGRTLTMVGACGAGGQANSGACTLDAAGVGNHFVVSMGSKLVLQSLRLVNGRCTIDNGLGRGNGGAIAAAGGSNVTLLSCALVNNTAAGSGGAVYSLGVVKMDGTAASDNRAGDSAGAVYADVVLDATSTTFSNNSALIVGGAVQTGDSAFITLSHVSFLRNRALEAQGGAVFARGAMSAEYVNATGNLANSHGAS